LEELAGELLSRVMPRRVGSEREGDNGALDGNPPASGAYSAGGKIGVAREEDLAEYMVFRPIEDRPAAGKGFQVERTGEGAFAVRGKGIERLLQRYDVENEDAMAYLEERLRRIGVLGALEAEGFQPGDELEVAGVTFELDPDAPA
jgi:Obg family GTPase CgtA-like protein